MEIEFNNVKKDDAGKGRTRSIKDPDLNIPITHNGKQGILLRTFNELAICKMAGDDTISYFWKREVKPWLEREKIVW